MPITCLRRRPAHGELGIGGQHVQTVVHNAREAKVSHLAHQPFIHKDIARRQISAVPCVRCGCGDTA